MLDPADRTVLTEALRAPVGFRLDHIVATTYTLDLIALLTLPLSFTLSSGDGITESGSVDPIALLEALRRHTGRITVFCQAGCIGAPRRGQLLFGYLESSVIEAKAHRERGVFHPKVAVIRYTADTRHSGPHAEEHPDPTAIRYRVLCGTRNLTFDRSWDTMLTLDGELRRDRAQVIRRNRPLSAFVQALPRLASSAIDDERKRTIERISEELLRVEFEVPEGFSQRADDLVFWPIGLETKDVWPFGGRTDRMLVISPFVDKTCLGWLKEQAELRTLVSRSEELDCVPPTALTDIESCYVLSDAAESETREDEAANAATGTSFEEKPDGDIPVAPTMASLRGLHTKLYVADCGWQARLWTGSANATEAAFTHNVEFLVELRGKRADIGIDNLLQQESPKGQQDKRVRLRDLLVPYSPPEVEHKLDEVEKKLERLIDEVRRKLVDAKLVARCVADGEQGRTFQVRVESGALISASLPTAVDCFIRPVSFAPQTAVRLTTLNGQIALFKSLAFESLTAFFAVRVTATEKNRELTQEFVLKLPLVGAPDDRDARLLLAMLSNRERLLRYLMMLLDDAGFESRGKMDGVAGNWGDWDSAGSFGIPLLEPLLRTLAEDPAHLDHIERLVSDLERTEEGKRLLPEELVTVWTAIRSARESGRALRKESSSAIA
jgi:hypothetical protein